MISSCRDLQHLIRWLEGLPMRMEFDEACSMTVCRLVHSLVCVSGAMHIWFLNSIVWTPLPLPRHLIYQPWLIGQWYVEMRFSSAEADEDNRMIHCPSTSTSGLWDPPLHRVKGNRPSIPVDIHKLFCLCRRRTHNSLFWGPVAKSSW